MLRNLLLFLFSLTLSQGIGQHKNNQIYRDNREIHVQKPSDKTKQRDYLPQTIVFKIKPESKTVFIQQKEKLPSLMKISKTIGIVSIEKLFPNVAPPTKAKNKNGDQLVDLSLIYVLKYSSPHTVEEVAAMIFKTGLVEYSEPYYTDPILAVPNDPYAQPTNLQGLYLENMKFYEALDIEDGDTSVVVGIIDTGIHWDHEDLVNSIKYNYADPINGNDDDGDGYIDNFRGWDLGSGDNNPYAYGNDHGTIVSGCAGATMNNGIGITGTAGKCKILPIKAATDDPGSSILKGYPGIIYGADHGCKVLNLSWGGPGGYSGAAQDVINYAAINHDVVVVAAAGNDATESAYYPASYENVLSVAGLDTMYHPGLDSIVEMPAYYATHNYYVDVGVMGRKLVSTYKDNKSYTPYAGGSSFACPLVSGAAALIRSKYPTLTALQVAELIRVTADPLIDTLPVNLPFKEEKLGKGRINIYRALTDHTSPALRMYEKHAYNKYGEYAFSGDSLQLICKFRNYLQPTANATVTLSAVSSYVTVTENSFNIGSLNTLASATNASIPFKVYIHPDAPINSTALFRLGYEDPGKNYTDYQYFEIKLNPPYVDIDTNAITLTITNNGRFGFTDQYSTVGSGLKYNNQNLLFEGGLMIGTSPGKVSDCVRGYPAGTVDSDFDYLDFARYRKFPEGDLGARVILTDTGTSKIGVHVEQRSYAYHNAPDNKYIITEYLIKNISGAQLDTVHVGIFSDWDIPNAGFNKANWDSLNNLGFTYYNGTSGVYAGVCLLTNNAPICYSLDHGPVGGNNIDPNDGFTTAEKFKTLSNGVGRPKAGGGGTGYDVSQVVGGTIYNLANNETRTIAFAHLVGDDLLDLQATTRRAIDLFHFYNTSSIPVVQNKDFCKGDTADVTIAPTNGSKFNFYTSPSSSTPVFTGSSYLIPGIFKSDTIYVKGADSLFESTSAMAKIIVHADVKADFIFVPSQIDLALSNTANFASTSQNASGVTWTISDGTTYTGSSLLHSFSTSGTYKVTLTAEDIYGCKDTISKFIKVTGTLTAIDPTIAHGVRIAPNPSDGFTKFEFMLPAPAEISISILNALGEEIWKTSDHQVMSKEYPVTLPVSQKGIYFAKITIDEEVVIQKIVVQ